MTPRLLAPHGFQGGPVRSAATGRRPHIGGRRACAVAGSVCGSPGVRVEYPQRLATAASDDSVNVVKWLTISVDGLCMTDWHNYSMNSVHPYDDISLNRKVAQNTPCPRR
jgi:hypothetical protein